MQKKIILSIVVLLAYFSAANYISAEEKPKLNKGAAYHGKSSSLVKEMFFDGKGELLVSQSENTFYHFCGVSSKVVKENKSYKN